ncbi:MAG TPA: ion transporter [Anaerolineae bacterium]|nr:ion transporter [Anaerolineae bacterium]HOQ99323.1 ion transporter [Anaerolineae bacterium]HPL27669.1 ion transporter [Anaerolineae bacterium]
MSGRNGPFWRWPDEERERLLEQISDVLALPMAILALIWVIVVVVDLAGIVPPALVPFVYDVDIGIWLFFLAEFVLEVIIAPHKLDYLRSHWLTALSVLLPFLAVLRILRAVVALRSLTLARAVLGANRATRGAAQVLGRGRFQYVALIAVIVVLIGAASVSFFERTNPQSELASFPEALWWAASLITTINTSSDPLTVEGRAIGWIMRVIALSIFGYLTGVIASFLVGGDIAAAEQAAASEERARLAEGLAGIQAQLDELQARLDRLLPPE